MEEAMVGNISRLFKYSRIFPYLIDNDYFLISRSVCRKCKPEELSLAQDAIAAVDGILNVPEGHMLYEKDISVFEELYQQLQAKDLPVEDPSERHIRRDIEALIRKAEDASSILAQYENLKTVLALIAEIKIFGNVVR